MASESSRLSPRVIGRVSSFSIKTGFGKISLLEDNPLIPRGYVFVHSRSVVGQQLQKNDTVSFRIKTNTGKNSAEAVDVHGGTVPLENDPRATVGRGQIIRWHVSKGYGVISDGRKKYYLHVDRTCGLLRNVLTEAKDSSTVMGMHVEFTVGGRAAFYTKLLETSHVIAQDKELYIPESGSGANFGLAVKCEALEKRVEELSVVNVKLAEIIKHLQNQFENVFKMAKDTEVLASKHEERLALMPHEIQIQCDEQTSALMNKIVSELILPAINAKVPAPAGQPHGGSERTGTSKTDNDATQNENNKKPLPLGAAVTSPLDSGERGLSVDLDYPGFEADLAEINEYLGPSARPIVGDGADAELERRMKAFIAGDSRDCASAEKKPSKRKRKAVKKAHDQLQEVKPSPPAEPNSERQSFNSSAQVMWLLLPIFAIIFGEYLDAEWNKNYMVYHYKHGAQPTIMFFPFMVALSVTFVAFRFLKMDMERNDDLSDAVSMECGLILIFIVASAVAWISRRGLNLVLNCI